MGRDNGTITNTPTTPVPTESSVSTTSNNITTTSPSSTTVPVPTTTLVPTTTEEPCWAPEKINLTIIAVGKYEASFDINVLEDTDRTLCITDILISCNATQNSALWSWVKVLGNVSIELNETYIHKVTITDLSPFTNYTCSVNGSLYPDFDLQTQQKVPSAPLQLNVSVLSSSSSHISWEEPEEIPSILEGYRMNITRVGVAHAGHIWRNCSTDDAFTYHLAETSFLFNESLADFNYTVTVEAVSSAGYGTDSSTSFVTPATAPSAPEQVSFNLTPEYYNKNIEFTQRIHWTMPCDTHGPVDTIHVGFIGYYLPNRTRTKEYNETIAVTNDVEYYHNITNIPAAMYFKVEIFLEGGIAYHGAFETENNYPSAPEVNEAIINSRNFTIIWREPANYPGPITKYVIDITGQGTNWPKTEHCNVDNGKYNYNDTVYPPAAEYFNSRVLPDTTYQIQLSAETSRGQGNLTSLPVTTEMSDPDILSISHHFSKYSNPEVYDETATIKFVPGCFNGKFSAYDIRFRGIRQNQMDHEDDAQITEYATNEYTFALKPEYDYTVSVTVRNSRYSKTSTLNFTSLAGVPIFDRNSFSKLSIKPGSTESTLTLDKDYFDSSRGTLKYLAIIVSDRNITGGEFNEWEDDSEWPTPERNSSIYYQATPKFWNPFAQTDILEYVLGENNNCPDDEHFCNKPLEPGREYFLLVRVFNANYYRNSMPVSFVTEKVTQLGLILGFLFGILCVFLFGLLIFIFWRRGIIKIISPRGKEGHAGTLQESSEALLSESFDKWPVFRHSVDSEIPGPTTEIPQNKFVEYCRYLEQNPDVLRAQWLELESQSKQIYEELPCHFSTISENKRKNRYTNILPFDHSRVKLHIDEDDEICSDYINASYIKGFSNEAEYIATQGPLPGTCRDFWKMILQEKVSIIVMVSRFIENNRDKCYKYFPNNRETMSINGDDIEVRCSTELHFGFHCIRTLQVKKDLRQVTVTQMQFLEWPDFGVPDSTDSMLHFCQQFKERWANEGGMAVIHCSAGVGRSGTLIATDILFRVVKAGRDIDVFNTVLELRRQRRSMVQTEKQYMYIHQLIRSMLESPVTDEDDSREHLYENIELRIINEAEIVESAF